jgi:hypothetical protein
VSFERIGAGLFRTCIVVCETVGGATLLKDAEKLIELPSPGSPVFSVCIYIFHDNTFFFEAKPSSPSLFCIYFRGPDGEASKEIAQTEEPAHSNEEIKLVVKQNYIYTLSHNEKPDA